MQTLSPSSGSQKPTGLEKLIRLAIPAGLIYGAIKLFNAFSPTLIDFFNNFWHIALIGTPAVFLVLFILKNPTFLWMGYKTLCRKITSFFIKLDPLSYMQRYIDYLREKRVELQQTKQSLNGDRVELEREIDSLKGNVEKGMKMASAAMKIGDRETANHQAEMANMDKKSIDLYIPIMNKMNSNLEFLNKLDENWGRSIESLAHTVERKRKEFEMLKKTAKALGKASEFASGDTEANRIYQESVIALEQNVSQKIAYIDEFMTNSKGAMKSMDIEKQMMNDEGMEMLDSYMKNGTVFLNEDFKKYEISVDPSADIFGKPIKTIQANATTISSPPFTNQSESINSGKSEFGNFLNK